MNRKAVIIGCAGIPDDKEYLPGVKSDISNFKNFLMSDNGGAWYEHEILVLYNETKSVILKELEKIRNEKYDLVFTVFSGHGNYSSINDCRRLYIDDTDFIIESNFYKLSNKQISIFDSCAGIEPEPIMMNFSCEGVERLLEKSMINYREIYETNVNNCPLQEIFLYSCDINEYSSDTSKGGLYSYNLISTAESHDKDLDVIQAHELAIPKVIRRSSGDQNPQFNISRRTIYKLPFTIKGNLI